MAGGGENGIGVKIEIGEAGLMDSYLVEIQINL